MIRARLATSRSSPWCWSRGTAPRTGAESGSATATGAGSGTTPESWVFPFNKPLEPKAGDNQALAVNTTDNTIRYDVAFALVWIEDDSPALNENEAYAFASCSNCAAVAIGFQVVLVTGENHVAVPQNISAAVNYDCVNCLTYALATQLFVTLDGPLSDGEHPRAERAVARDRCVRDEHRDGAPQRDPGPADRVRGQDPRHHRGRPGVPQRRQ